MTQNQFISKVGLKRNFLYQRCSWWSWFYIENEKKKPINYVNILWLKSHSESSWTILTAPLLDTYVQIESELS